MRKFLYRLISVLLVFGCIAGLMLAGGTEEARLFPELTQETVAGWPTEAEAAVQSEAMLGIGKMTCIAEDGGVQLYYHGTTGELALKSSTGEIWYSNPQNRMEFDALSQGHYASLVYADVITANESEKTMYSYDDCVQYGQSKTSAIDGGIRIEYLFGRAEKQALYPQALTEERYKEIEARLDPSEVMYFSRYYTLADISSVSDRQILETLKETYTNLEELKRIYILKSNPSVLEINRILEYLQKIGYTAEDREKDNLLTGYQRAGSQNDHFLLPIEITLEKGKLHVKVCTDEMSVLGLLKVESIVVLPFWNTVDGAAETTVVIPDGCGALIELGKTVSSSVSDYEERIFGEDFSLSRTARTSVKENLYFPVYGIINRSGGFYAEIKEGAERASLLVAPKNADKPIGSAGFRFRLFDYADTKLLESDTETVRSYPDDTDLSPVEIVYSFPEVCRDFMDIASEYRQELTADGRLSSAEETDVPAVIQLLGAIDDTEPFLGVPREKLRRLTSYSEAQRIIGSLKNELAENQLVVQYTGWQKGGVKSGTAAAVKPEKLLGGADGFRNLLAFCGENGVQLMPDADFQYVYRNTAFDGFSKSKDAALTVLSEKAYKPTFSPANFNPDSDRLFGYVVNPVSSLKMAESFVVSSQKYGISGITLPYIGTELSGDFSEKNYISRGKAADYAEKMLETLKVSGLSLMSGGANAYAFPFCEYVCGISMQSNPHPLISESVPFVQAVLSGSVRYAATSLNKATGEEIYTLKCIETASVPYVSIMAADNSVLKDTAYDCFGAVNEAGQAERFCRVAKNVTEALKPVYGSKMTGYSSNGGIVRVSYENGVTVVVNYNDRDVVLPEGITVGARGYGHIEKG